MKTNPNPLAPRFGACSSVVDVAAMYPSLLDFCSTNRLVLVPAALLLVLGLAFAILPEIM